MDNFLDHKLSFLGMADVVRATMDELSSGNQLGPVLDIEAVLDIDLRARSIAKKIVDKF